MLVLYEVFIRFGISTPALYRFTNKIFAFVACDKNTSIWYIFYTYTESRSGRKSSQKGTPKTRLQSNETI